MTAHTGIHADLGFSKHKIDTASLIISVLSLAAVLWFGLLPAFLTGMLVFQIVHSFTPFLSRIGIVPNLSKSVILLIIATVVLTGISFGIIGLASFLSGSSGGLSMLMQKMAEAIDTARTYLPAWLGEYLPTGVGGLHDQAATWLREYAAQIRMLGKKVGASLVYILFGMIIGGIVAFNSHRQSRSPKPLAAAMMVRINLLNIAFRQIVFSQIKISAVNTALTAFFLLFVLPVFDVDLPLKHMLIAITFIAGLLPIIGNVISNTVTVLITLGVSPVAAVGVLAFLVFIHKLEYFLNAHIIGTNIKAHAWELLLAMLAMEAMFGIKGLIAAPIYYAYLKEELVRRGLI